MIILHCGIKFCMKKITAFIFISICILFVSCVDVEEKIFIGADNSGTYTMVMDMGKLIEMMKSFKPGETDKLNQLKDTTILFKDLLAKDGAEFTAEEKAMLERGKMSIYADADKDEMTITTFLPFNNMEQLAWIKLHSGEIFKKLKPNKSLLQGEDDMQIGGEDIATGDMPIGINPSQSAYTFKTENSRISNSLTDKSKISGLMNDSSMQMIRSMTMMMGDMTYRTTFILPQPVKEYKGNDIEISDDKKTITFINSFTEMFEHPEYFEYSLNW